MIPNPKRKCEYPDCKLVATYGLQHPERCDDHKQLTDQDLVLQRCIACLNPSVVDEKQMCAMCDGRGSRIRLGRQLQVKAALDNCSFLPKYEFYDKIAFDDTSCGRERPDFVWDVGTFKVILEVDEDQHKGYPCDCEQKRMVNITQGLGMPCVWVRYNPDGYKGQMSLTRDRRRLDLLMRVLKECIELPAPDNTTDHLRVIHLFFDGFNPSQSYRIEKINCI